LFERALSIRRSVGDRQGEMADLVSIGVTRGILGDSEASIAMLRESLELALALRDRHGEAVCRINLGTALLLAGQFSGALAEMDRGLALAGALDLKEMVCAVRAARGETLHRLGKMPEALAETDEAIRLGREIGFPAGLAQSLMVSATLRGDLSLADEAGTVARASERRDLVCEAWLTRADILRSNGDAAAATEAATRALRLARRLGLTGIAKRADSLLAVRK